MGKIKLKNLPRLKLTNLLKRRKSTLNDFMKEFGLTTYESLKITCARMGVETPTIEEFNELDTVSNGKQFINSPAEGVVTAPAPEWRDVMKAVTVVVIDDDASSVVTDILDGKATEGSVHADIDGTDEMPDCQLVDTEGHTKKQKKKRP